MNSPIAITHKMDNIPYLQSINLDIAAVRWGQKASDMPALGEAPQLGHIAPHIGLNATLSWVSRPSYNRAPSCILCFLDMGVEGKPQVKWL